MLKPTILLFILSLHGISARAESGISPQAAPVGQQSQADSTSTTNSKKPEKEAEKAISKEEDLIFDLKDTLSMDEKMRLSDSISVKDEDEEESDLIPLSLLLSFSEIFLFGNNNKNLALNYFTSNEMQVLLFYDYRISESFLYISPALGFSFESYNFKEKYIPRRAKKNPERKVSFVAAHRVVTPYVKSEGKETTPEESIISSKLYLRYLNCALEVRGHKRPKNYKKSFFMALGLRLGARIGTHRTIAYKEDGQSKKLRLYEHFDFNTVRVDPFMRLGYSRLGLIISFSGRKLVKSDKWKIDSKMDLREISIGLSFDFF